MGLFWAKYARRIFAIVSTTSIPDLAPVSPTEATVDPPSRGSRLDADHPENGVLIPCRFTFCKTQYASSLAEHRWVAELIRSVASVAQYAHVYDEGDYYHTLEIEDAAKAIHENGVLINAIGHKLNAVFGAANVAHGGETKIKPLRTQADGSDELPITQ
jgi:hypothetical protein